MSLSHFVIAGLFVSTLAAVAGCGTAKDDADKGDVVANAESDLKLSGTKYLGRIANEQTRTASYDSKPRYRSYAFDAKGGDTVTVDVTSTDGDAVAWITDAQYRILSGNDDASETTFDAKATYVVPAEKAASSFRVVFREYALDPATFDVKLHIESPPATCGYEGQTYRAGDEFSAADGCNVCSCGADGTTSCSNHACACNPAVETNRTYVGTPEQCMIIRYGCAPGRVPFSNTCGCGCETVQ